MIDERQDIHPLIDRLEAVEAIRLGIAAAKEGRGKPARQALAELQEKLGIGAFSVQV